MEHANSTRSSDPHSPHVAGVKAGVSSSLADQHEACRRRHGRKARPSRSDFAYADVAINDAVNSIDGRFQPSQYGFTRHAAPPGRCSERRGERCVGAFLTAPAVELAPIGKLRWTPSPTDGQNRWINVGHAVAAHG